LGVGLAAGCAACAAVLGIESTTVDPTLDQDSAVVPFDSGGPREDSGTLNPVTDADTDSGPIDAGPACNPTLPWNAPRPLTELNLTTGSDHGARLEANELTVYMGRGQFLFRATRPNVKDTFGVLTAMEVNNVTNATSSHFTTGTDGVRAYFATIGRPDSTGVDIFTTSRATLSDPFIAPTKAVGVPANRNEDHPFLRHDGKVLYWDSTDGLNNSIDIWRGDVGMAGAITNASVVPSLQTAANESSPVVTADDLTIYFSRLPGPNVFMAKRAQPIDNWGAATPVNELNSTQGERVTWLSADGCRMVLYSDRSGMGDLYVTEKPK